MSYVRSPTPMNIPGVSPTIQARGPFDLRSDALDAVGLLIALLASSFHHLTVQDQGEVLAIHFGPVPPFRRTVDAGQRRAVEDQAQTGLLRV